MAQDEVVQEMWYSYSRKQESGDGEGDKIMEWNKGFVL